MPARWIPLLAVPALLAMAPPPPAVAQQAPEFERRLESALAILDSTEIERGLDSLRALVASAGSSIPRQLVARAQLHLAAAHWALGSRDSAMAHFREMVRANPFAVPDEWNFNPDIQRAFRQARRSTPALDLRIAADTVIRPASDLYLVPVAVGEPRQVTVALLGPDSASPAATSQPVAVDSTATIPLALRSPDSLPIPPGSYRLVVRAGSDLEVSTRIAVSALPVDTTAHEPPLDPSSFRVETRPGPPNGASLAGGLLLGAAAALLPQVVSNRDLSQPGVNLAAISVGSGIAATGLLGAFVGRRPVPIPENVEYNRRLRESWDRRNQEIAASNAARRRWAPLRLRLVSQ